MPVTRATGTSGGRAASESNDEVLPGSSSTPSTTDTVAASTVRIELKCSIMEAQRTVHKFNPGNVGREEAASIYINWASKMQSWLMLIGIDGLLKKSEAEIYSDVQLNTLNVQFYALLHSSVENPKASSIVTQA